MDELLEVITSVDAAEVLDDTAAEHEMQPILYQVNTPTVLKGCGVKLLVVKISPSTKWH